MEIASEESSDKKDDDSYNADGCSLCSPECVPLIYPCTFSEISAVCLRLPCLLYACISFLFRSWRQIPLKVTALGKEPSEAFSTASVSHDISHLTALRVEYEGYEAFGFLRKLLEIRNRNLSVSRASYLI